MIKLLRTISLRDVLWFLFGWVLMLLIPAEEEAPNPLEFAEDTRRRNGAQ